MTLEVGTIAHWRNFEPGRDKFIYILGINAANEVLSFTISSQTKYLTMHPHAQEMVEIPKGTVECFQKACFIRFLSRICEVILVPGGVPSCDKGRFPWHRRYESRR